MILVSIVEDQHDLRRSLVRQIDRQEGMRCISDFGSGESALIQLPTQKPDIVLMDIGLPKMNGISCMLQLKRKVQNIDFIMFTVFEEDELVFDALKAGAVGYILKAGGAKEVVQAIKEYQLGGSPMSRVIARKVLSSFSNQNKKHAEALEPLSKTQKQILEHLADGLLNKEIADLMNITEGTVKQHNYAIYQKLQVNNRVEAVKKYLGSH